MPRCLISAAHKSSGKTTFSVGACAALRRRGLDVSLGAKIVVQRERRGRGGKTVTRVQGLEIDAAGRARLAKELARALGCGARLEDGDILLQGAKVERVADWLERRGAPRVIRGN